MEEKERFEWSEPDADGVFDNETGETWDALELVREQYKRIKELEETIRQQIIKLQKQFAVDTINALRDIICEKEIENMSKGE